jgi:hypothetical protein
MSRTARITAVALTASVAHQQRDGAPWLTDSDLIPPSRTEGSHP